MRVSASRKICVTKYGEDSVSELRRVGAALRLPAVAGEAARPIRVRGARGVPSLKRWKALPKSDADEALAGLLEWSEPVVFDCLRECYRMRLKEPQAGSLAHRHVRQWRALIAGDTARFEDLRHDLVAALAALELDVGCAVEADACALAELYEIAVARFDRSPRSAQACRDALSALAGKLAPPNHERAAA